MNDYRQRIAKTAIRCTGQPVTLSPQLEDYNIFPELKTRMCGGEADFRLVLFLGYIDMNDVAITFPADHIIKVHVKHDFKAVDELSHRIRRQGRSFPVSVARTHRELVCSRDCATFYSLPLNVEKGSLSAQWTQDGFLVIQSRREATVVEGFDSKRLVPIKVCLVLDPCLNLNDLSCKAQAVLRSAMNLWAKVEAIAPRNEFDDVYGGMRLEGDDDTNAEAGNGGANADSQSGVREGETGPLAESETGEKKTGSAVDSEANRESGEKKTGSAQFQSGQETDDEETDSPVNGTTGSAQSKASEETGEKDSGSTAQSTASEETGDKDSGSTAQSRASEETGEKDSGSTAQSKASEETSDKDSGSTAQSKASEDSCKQDSGSSTQKKASEGTLIADSKAVTEKTSEEKSSGSKSTDNVRPELKKTPTNKSKGNQGKRKQRYSRS